MSAKVKLFVIDGIFTLLSLGWFLAVNNFLSLAGRRLDTRDFFHRGFWAFVIIIAGLLFFYFISRLIVKRLNLKDEEQLWEMKTWQKILFIIAICEVWGLTTLALLDWCWNTHLLLGEDGYNVLGRLCWSSDFAFQIISQWLELFNLHPSMLIPMPLLFYVQFLAYAIIGLIISIFVCRKSKQTNIHSNSGN